MSVSVTTDFRHAYESDRRDRMRRRFLTFTLVMVAIQIVTIVFYWRLFDLAQLNATRVGLGALVLLSAILYVGAHYYVRLESRRLRRGAIVGFAISLMVVGALLRLPHAFSGMMNSGAPVVSWAVGIFLSHFIASFFIPWTARESMIPFAVFIPIGAAIGFARDGVGGLVGSLFLFAAIGAPGVLVAWYLSSSYRQKFQNRFLRSAYRDMKRELVDARRIHEDLFPDEIEKGPVCVRYAYEPMSQIGGDYLFLRSTATSTMIVLIDVTGHGVTAALTINRLHGELQRVMGEQPEIGAGEVLRDLNRYIHLTLATHSVYATAVAFRIEHHSTVAEYASAGHPPAFLMGVDGSIDQLDSTTFLLGVCHGEDFVPDERAVDFRPGDTLIAYTDGATEAMNRDGRMLGVMGFLRTVAGMTPGDEGWSRALKREVEDYRDGPAADDTLLVEVVRPLHAKPAPDEA